VTDEPKKPRHTVSGEPPQDGHWDGPAPAPIEKSTKQHADHWVLPPEDRAKGFVRPLRASYKHEKCGTVTNMPKPIAETYARQPGYYGSTFCACCACYLPVGLNGEFVWLDDGKKVGA
jgi:hypothetical protein